MNIHQTFLVEEEYIHSKKKSIFYNLQKGTTPILQPKSSCTPKAPYTPKASSRGVTDTIYNEATTKAFSGDIVGKCRLKFTYIEIGSHQKYP